MKSHPWTVILAFLVGCGSVDALPSAMAPQSALVDDFEDLDLVNHLGAMNAVFHDTLMPPSTISLEMTTTGSTLAGATSRGAARISGVMQPNVGPNYPFCLLELPLNAPAGRNVLALAPMRQLTF